LAEILSILHETLLSSSPVLHADEIDFKRMCLPLKTKQESNGPDGEGEATHLVHISGRRGCPCVLSSAQRYFYDPWNTLQQFMVETYLLIFPFHLNKGVS
jgi:hypothetical protein